jgi:hypothetical protein
LNDRVQHSQHRAVQRMTPPGHPISSPMLQISKRRDPQADFSHS